MKNLRYTIVDAGDAIREADVMVAGTLSRQQMNQDQGAVTAAH